MRQRAVLDRPTPFAALASAVCDAVPPSWQVLLPALQSDILAESLKLQKDVTIVHWYPVLNLGLGYQS